MNKLNMVLATLVALLGATASWAQDTEESEPAAAAVAVAEPAGCDTGCCDKQDTCRSGCRSRCNRADCDAGCQECGSRRTGCDKGCGKRCSLSAICEWLCFRRETVCCPKGPAPRNPPLYTFFPCDDCGDGCGGACNTCNK